MTAQPRYHVLLIGIDAYGGGGTLSGCVNDVDAIQRLLVERVGVSRDSIVRLAAPLPGASHDTSVPAALPTLGNIQSALEWLGTDAVGRGDRVLIYYSGHGTQTIVRDGNDRRFAREAVVPYAGENASEYRLLFDWELNAMVARIAERTPRVTIVLDCCHSAGVTRGGDHRPGARDRFRPMPEIARWTAGHPLPTDPLRGVVAGLSGLQRCQVIAACRDHQRARESVGRDGMTHGELTRALVTCLAAVPREDLADLRWGRVWRAVEAAVSKANPDQNPCLSGNFGRRIFGFQPDEDADAGFSVVRAARGYRIDVGTLAGVTEKAVIAVYPAEPAQFPALGSAADLAARAGNLQVTAAERATCDAIAITPFKFPEAARGRLVQAGRAARLRVALEPWDEKLAAALRRSELIEVVEGEQTGGDPLDLTLLGQAGGGWALTDDVHGSGDGDQPVLAVIPPAGLAAARAVVEHYHAYVTPLRMARACPDLPNLLQLSVLDCRGARLGPDTAQAPNLPQVEPGTRAPYDVTVGDPFCYDVINDSDVRLNVTLFNCAASGKVVWLGEKPIPRASIDPVTGKAVRRSRHVFWRGDALGTPFLGSLPDDRVLGLDRIVAIATTREGVSLRHLERRQSFADLITQQRDDRRHRGGDDDRSAAQPPPVERWTAAMTTISIRRRPGEIRPGPSSGSSGPRRRPFT
jgi:hypothetical protein